MQIIEGFRAHQVLIQDARLEPDRTRLASARKHRRHVRVVVRLLQLCVLRTLWCRREVATFVNLHAKTANGASAVVREHELSVFGQIVV